MIKRKFEDLTGQVFGRLTVIERDYSKNNTSWLCKCECDKIKSTRGNALKSGKTKSCGCLNKELSDARKYKHGLNRTKEHVSWCHIKQRCYNTKDKNYHSYGGRGITLFEEWINNPKAFIDYIKSLENYGVEKLSLDRINNDGNYEPGNLRWATRKEQARNRRNITITIETAREIRLLSKNISMKEISRLLNIRYSTVISVVNNKIWSEDV